MITLSASYRAARADMLASFGIVESVPPVKPEIPEHLRMYVLDTPALDGRTVCQGHADVCEIIGHGYNVRDGVEQGTCPRCGTVTRS